MRLIRYVLALVPVLLLMANVSSPLIGKKVNAIPVIKTGSSFPASYTDNNNITIFYFRWNLNNSGLTKRAFDEAIRGYDYLLHRNLISRPGMLTIIDYSKPSTQKRLFVIDMIQGKVLFKTLVAHAKNSGYNYATDFSNEEASHKSSLGFYITLNTYRGANGYSLKLKGCEKGINDKAGERAIVMHGAEYVSETFIRNYGYLGRSYGCPAVPMGLHIKIIDQIKNGTCMFLYHPVKKYHIQSKILGS